MNVNAWTFSVLLAQQSPVLILDEPTSALDGHHQFQLMGFYYPETQQKEGK
ncbi:hypothetical protein O9929_26230 [Vibrio lentus]|nr:hypothetical protein [Vibrio lentus]